jgi:hypothetical protein
MILCLLQAAISASIGAFSQIFISFSVHFRPFQGRKWTEKEDYLPSWGS